MPTIQIGTAGEMGILIAGIMVGIYVTIKVIDWIKHIAGARDGTAPKYQPPSYGRTYLTPEEHKRLCEAAGKATGDALKQIQKSIEQSNGERKSDIQLIFTKLGETHEDIKDRLSKHGERIASLETEMRLKRNGN